MNENLGCINPHGMWPFPANRDVCPDCQAIRAKYANPVFSPRHGLRYRWWRDIPWDVIVVTVVLMIMSGVLAALVGAWIFDWKLEDVTWP